MEGLSMGVSEDEFYFLCLLGGGALSRRGLCGFGGQGGTAAQDQKRD
jgi:hypothetical protein